MNSSEIDSYLLVPPSEACIVRPDPEAYYVGGVGLDIPPFRRDYPGLEPQLSTAPLYGLQVVPSGVRSVLFYYEEKLYRTKGVSLVDGKLITTSAGSQDAKGGMFLDAAQYEQEMVGDLGKALRKMGLYYGLSPRALIDYQSSIDRNPCGAAIYEVDGDDRLGRMLYYGETTLPFKYLRTRQADRMLDVFNKLATMSGQVLRIFHNLGYSWSEDMKGSGTNSHPGNMMISNNRGTVGMSIVDLDCAIQRDSTYFMDNFILLHKEEHPEDARAAEEIRDLHHERLQGYDLDTFSDMLIKPLVANTHEPEEYDPDSVASNLVGEYLRDSGKTNNQRISERTKKILRALRPRRVRRPLRASLEPAFQDGYSKYASPKDLVVMEWSDLRKFFRDDIPQFREDFMNRVRRLDY